MVVSHHGDSRSEDVEVVYGTASACTQFDYPHEKLKTYILDDGGTFQKLKDPQTERAGALQQRAEQLKAVAARLGISYLTRPTFRVTPKMLTRQSDSHTPLSA